MKSATNTLLYIAGLIAALALATYIPCKRYSVAEKLNSKAVRENDFSPKEAREHLEKAIRLNPHNPVYHLNKGLTDMNDVSDMILDSFLKRENVELTTSLVSNLEKAVKNSFNESIPVLNLAIAYAMEGDEEKALTLLEPLTKQDYCWLPVMVCYALLLESRGDDCETGKFVSFIIESNPIVLESRYFEDLKERNPIIAYEALESAMADAKTEYKNNANPLCIAKLGELEYLNGNNEGAEILLREALSELPSMNRPWLFLGRIEEERGNVKDALPFYVKSIQLDPYDALPVYFKAKAEGKTYVMAEQMRSLLSSRQRSELRLRYRSLPLSSVILMKGFDEYCTYDFLKEIEQDRYERNVAVMDGVLSSIDSLKNSAFQNLTALIARKLSGTPCEAGLLDVYPETLRIILDKTDKLQFIESCVALALTAKNISISDGANHSACSYDLLSDNIRRLRYRDGVANKFSDRLFYFSEWVVQAQRLGLLEEYTHHFGHEYRQLFSYLSDHLYLLSNVSSCPDTRDEIIDSEHKLEEMNPYYVISPEEMSKEFYDYLRSGDIVALVSDRKGEDISKIGIICGQEPSFQLIYASYKDKIVVVEDLRKVCQSSSGIRTFRIKTIVS